MFRSRDLAWAVAAFALVTSCGVERPASRAPAPNSTPDTLPTVQLDVDRSSNVATVTQPASSTKQTTEPRSQTVQLDQPAIWPASDIAFGTPEEAAASFVSDALGVTPVLGTFSAGDSRSGEIAVFSSGDGGSADLVERGLLAVRMIGPNDGWFVIAASSQGVSIGSPATLDRVPAGPLAVSGRGRGFEGTLNVTAFRAGAATDELDQVIASGGAFGSLQPFSVTLDLSSGTPGDVIALIVRGDTGLDGDPGDFTSIPIVIGDPLPETR